jgi:LPXTG-motif cell wall-anchored protein
MTTLITEIIQVLETIQILISNSGNGDNSSSNKDSINQDSNVNSNDSKHDKQNELPETGEKEVRNGTLFGTLFAGLGSLLLFTKRRRKENDKNKYLNYCK